jgi:hypothetical protein
MHPTYQQWGNVSRSRAHRVAALEIWQALELPIDAAPLPKNIQSMFKAFRPSDGHWAGLVMRSYQQFGWLMDIFATVGFLVSLLARVFQRFKKTWLFWFLGGVAIVLVIGWLWYR